MKIKRQMSMILVCLFATLASAQSEPRSFKQVVLEGLDSIGRAYGFALHDINVLGDTAVRPFINERISPDPKAVIYVHTLERRMGETGGQMRVSGTIISLKPPKSPENFSFIASSFAESEIPNVSKLDRSKDEEGEGFWDGVLQPTLVTLGAVAVIALFFLIRS